MTVDETTDEPDIWDERVAVPSPSCAAG